MRTRTRKLLDDRIDILNRNAVDASPAHQVFRTVSTIIALTRVCILVLESHIDSHWRSNQDKMIHNEDCVHLSEYCFNICMALEPPIQGKNTDDLNESLRIAIEDLERCVNQSWPYHLLTTPTNRRLTRAIELTLRRGASTPHAKYNKGKVEEHKLKIQDILGGFNPQSSPLDGNISGIEAPTPVAPAVSGNIVGTSVVGGGMFSALRPPILRETLTVP